MSENITTCENLIRVTPIEIRYPTDGYTEVVDSAVETISSLKAGDVLIGGKLKVFCVVDGVRKPEEAYIVNYNGNDIFISNKPIDIAYYIIDNELSLCHSPYITRSFTKDYSLPNKNVTTLRNLMTDDSDMDWSLDFDTYIPSDEQPKLANERKDDEKYNEF